MALDIDTSKELRRPADLVALVRSIVDATSADEPDWLEWKSDLDLTAAAGRFTVAKAILGLANRMPNKAKNHCAGLGYVVVGAEPANLCGTRMIDPAELDDALAPYLGDAKAPQWNPTYVLVEGAEVLVVIVEAPSDGDPMFLLRKQHEKALKGTVFVRRPGKTTPATDAEMDALQQRLIAARRADDLALDVTLVGDVPLRWYDPSTYESDVEGWLDVRRSKHMRRAEEVERRRTQPSTPDPNAPAATYLSLGLADTVSRISEALAGTGLSPEPDTRTLEEYEAQLDDWVDLLRETADEIVFGELLRDRNRTRDPRSEPDRPEPRRRAGEGDDPRRLRERDR